MLTLTPITAAEFQVYKNILISGYADQSVKSGRVAADTSVEWSEEEMVKILPKDLDTEGHFIFKIINTDSELILGYIWFANQPDNKEHAYLFDINLLEEHRGQGYGRKAMELLEIVLKEKGYVALGLHVYCFNEGAIKLYQSIGFETTSLLMRKNFD